MQVSHTTLIPVSTGSTFRCECESFQAVHQDGKLLLEIRGATQAPNLPLARNYLTKAQVAKRLGTSQRTLEKWMRSRRNPIPHVRLGSRPRFLEDEILAWAQAGATCTARRAQARISAASPAARVSTGRPLLF